MVFSIVHVILLVRQCERQWESGRNQRIREISSWEGGDHLLVLAEVNDTREILLEIEKM